MNHYQPAENALKPQINSLKELLSVCQTLFIVVLFFTPFSVKAAEGVLDTTTIPAEKPTAEAKYTSVPKINFFLSDEKFLLIQVNGLLLKDIDGFTWGGTDISGLISPFEQQGVIKFTEKTDGFQMNVNIPIDQLSGKTEFGVLYGHGNKLSAVVDSEKLLKEIQDSTSASKGFGYTRLYGIVIERSGWCYYGGCGSTYASYADVHFYAWRGYWAYIGSTTTDANGYYNVSYEGNNEPYIHIQAQKNGKTASYTQRGPACACTSSVVKTNLDLQ